MKFDLKGLFFSTIKFAFAGLVAWIIPTLVVVWNGKDEARAFIKDTMKDELQVIKESHTSEIRLINATLTPMREDIGIIKTHILRGNK